MQRGVVLMLVSAPNAGNMANMLRVLEEQDSKKAPSGGAGVGVSSSSEQGHNHGHHHHRISFEDEFQRLARRAGLSVVFLFLGNARRGATERPHAFVCGCCLFCCLVPLHFCESGLSHLIPGETFSLRNQWVEGCGGVFCGLHLVGHVAEERRGTV